MEILAPAGNFEAFFAALEQGADAIYVGIKGFNARSYARNFSLQELAYLVPYAHQHGCKVFVALNTIVKETELKELTELALALSKIKPDALIIQDLGVFHLFKTHFPHLRLHASTLMTAHNLAGVKQLEKLGFARVVLARELTLEEIKEIRRQTQVEIEVFVHGALCFSYSGLCLASSYLGGYSSVRGNCRQPCRFLYQSNGHKGYYLSCGDLCALELLPRLKEMGINSVKIEGRMKSAEYVAAVVKAYRLVRDASVKELPAAIQYARQLIAQVGNRRLCTGFFLSPNPQDVLDPQSPSAFGIFLGRVFKKEEGKIYLTTNNDIKPGDRLRAQSETLGQGISWKVKEVKKQGDVIVINAPLAVKAGYLVFKVNSADIKVSKSDKRLKEQLVKAIKPVDFKKALKKQRALADWITSLKPKPVRPSNKTCWWVKHEQVEFFLDYHLPPNSRPMLVLTMHSYSALIHHVRRLQKRCPDLVLCLPAVILPSQLAFFKKAVNNLINLGFSRWHLGNIGHFDLIPDKAKVYLTADYTFNLANHLALNTLQQLNVKHLTVSAEIDKICLKKLVHYWDPGKLIMPVFGRIPIFTSRLQLNLPKNGCLTSPLGEHYYPLMRDKVTFILPESPISLSSHLEELKRLGITNYLIDLRFLLQKQIKRIITARKVNLPQGHAFNFKRGWK